MFIGLAKADDADATVGLHEHQRVDAAADPAEGAPPSFAVVSARVLQEHGCLEIELRHTLEGQPRSSMLRAFLTGSNVMSTSAKCMHDLVACQAKCTHKKCFRLGVRPSALPLDDKVPVPSSALVGEPKCEAPDHKPGAFSRLSGARCAASGVRLKGVVLAAEQLHQLGMNEQSFLAERHLAQHALVGQLV